MKRPWSVAVLLVATACGGSEPAPSSPAPMSPPPLPPGMAGAGASSSASPAAPVGKGSSEVDRATQAIKANDFRSAKALLETALQKNPQNGTASYYLGVALENLGDKAGAEQKYKDAMANAPELSEAPINLGALYLDQSRWDDAALVTRHGLEKRSDDPALHANLAMALRGKGDKQGALAEYERAIKTAGDNAELRYAYASLLLEVGNKPKAAAELKAALGGAAGNRALLASTGRLLGSAGAFADCVAALDKAISLGDDAELRVRRGLCRHAMKDEPGAAADFEAATKVDPKFAPAHYYLGESLLASGDGAKAEKEFDLAANAAPHSELGNKARAQIDALRKKKSK